jgi:hypothetical protein
MQWLFMQLCRTYRCAVSHISLTQANTRQCCLSLINTPRSWLAFPASTYKIPLEAPYHAENTSGQSVPCRDEISRLASLLVMRRIRGSCLAQWYSTLFVRVPPDIIFLQLCTPKVVGTEFKLYTVYNLHLK